MSTLRTIAAALIIALGAANYAMAGALCSHAPSTAQTVHADAE
ncbi:MAG: hypothetical protein AAGJ73_16060 [Pseudomonadota bacterium]